MAATRSHSSSNGCFPGWSVVGRGVYSVVKVRNEDSVRFGDGGGAKADGGGRHVTRLDLDYDLI